MKKILIFVMLLCFLNINVKAASSCNYQEQVDLNSKVGNIKVNYDLQTETKYFEDILEDVTFEYFHISIYNLTEEFYITVSDDLTKEVLTFSSTDAEDGVVTFDRHDTSEINNLTFKVYTTSNTSCPGELYKTLYLTLPRYNEYSDRGTCEFIPDFYLCQKYVTFANVDEETFLKQVHDYEDKLIDSDGKETPQGDKDNPLNNILDFINKYKWVFVGVAAGGVVGVTVFLYKKKKEREF